MSSAEAQNRSVVADAAVIRDAGPADVAAVIHLDERISGIAKPEFWGGFAGAQPAREKGIFLVAEVNGTVVGFIVGEVRAWEFGSPPCGWIFAIGVDPDCRLAGIGSRLFEAICGRFKEAGVTTVRTMLARDDTLIMSFFRSQCMRAGPFIELETTLE